MRILKVEPGKAPYAKEMEEGLKAIQREVEGLFQPLSMGDGVILCCNDEGKLNGMQPNRRLGDDIICGPFFFVGDDHAGGFCSLTEEQIQRYTQMFQEPEQFTGQEPELEPHIELYLPKSVKAQVDAIVERLAQLPEVAACYDQWWQLKDEIAGYYGRNTPPRQPLTQRKEFRSLKNWIIREAEDISFSPSADSTEPGEKQSTEKTPPIRGSVDVQSVGETVSARHIPANVVMRLLHHMGQIFRTSMPVIPPALRIDSKRRRRLQEKRMALGHKRDDHEDEQLHHVNDNTM